MSKGNIANGEMAEGKEEVEVKKKLNNCEEGGDELIQNDKQIQRNSRSINSACLLKYMSLLVLVLQNTSQVLVMRYATTRDANEHPAFLKTVAVFFNEVVKFFAALTLFFISTGNFFQSISLLKHHFITNFLDTLKVGVPAFIYVIQNFLLYVAVENLDAGTYMVTYQLKILTTAMFTVLMLKRKLSVQQWVALLILIAGVATVQISAQKRKSSSALGLDNSPISSNYSTSTNSTISLPVALPIQQGRASQNEQSPLLGFVTIIVACFLSGFAGIYFEKILKGSDVSVWLRNTQLAALSIPIGLIVIFFKDRQRVMEDGFMQGFDFVVWGVVLLQALGGLVVAVVIKYADNILKAFATSVSIVVATVASIFIFAIFPTPLFIGGADGTKIAEHGFLFGWDSVVWLTAFWYAVGGLSVAVCLKYADNIAKNFATSVAIILATIGSIQFFGFHPSILFILGAFLVILSIFLYSSSSTFIRFINGSSFPAAATINAVISPKK